MSTFCFDEDPARATRKAFLATCAGCQTTVLGTHFANPTAIKVYRDGLGGQRFKPAFETVDLPAQGARSISDQSPKEMVDAAGIEPATPTMST